MRAALRQIILAPRPHNLLLQSEDIGTTWTNTNSAENTNAAVAPDGSTTADRLIDDAATGTAAVGADQSSIGLASGAPFTYSAHLKADQLSWARLEFGALASLGIRAWFNLSTGAVGTQGANNAGAGTIDVGDGWYRCWISFYCDLTDVTGNAVIRLADGDNDNTVDRDGTSSIFAWGMQVNRGLKPTRYVKTTTAIVP